LLYIDIREAIAREKAIKRKQRAQKIALIESMNPHWQDLSKE
jgi:putative endonuclease